MSRSIEDIQDDHQEWADENFGDRDPNLTEGSLLRTLRMANLVGNLAHYCLKSDQGIRGEIDEHLSGFSEALSNIQTRTFSDSMLKEEGQKDAGSLNEDRRVAHTVLGAVEEAGELADAVYRGNDEESKDAVGDIVMYLLDFCNEKGWDFVEIVQNVSSEVHDRDWNENPETGKETQEDDE